jgi:hypothetical protein
MNQFKETFKQAVSETNLFFEKNWLTFKSSTEKIKISPFKKINLF